MKISITERLAVGHEPGTYLLIGEDGKEKASSANTTFNDLVEIPLGEYLVVKVLPATQEQLGCDLEIIGVQNHVTAREVQEYEFGNMPTNIVQEPTRPTDEDIQGVIEAQRPQWHRNENDFRALARGYADMEDVRAQYYPGGNREDFQRVIDAMKWIT